MRLVALIAGILSCGALVMFSSDASAATPPNFRVDAVPGGSVDTLRLVSVGTTFSVDVTMDAYDGPAWTAYSIRLIYDDGVIDVAGVPADWGATPVQDSSAGNLTAFPNGAACGPDPASNAISSEDDLGAGFVQVECADAG